MKRTRIHLPLALICLTALVALSGCPCLPGMPWTRIFGQDGDDVLMAIQHVPAGYVVAGFTEKNHEDPNVFYVALLSSCGETVWTSTFAGTGDAAAMSITRMADGGYLAGGVKDKDAYAVKLNSKGDRVWEYVTGGPNEDIVSECVALPDGSAYLCLGMNMDTDDAQTQLVKLNAQGGVIWHKIVADAMLPTGVAATADGQAVVACWNIVPGDLLAGNVLMTKFDANGGVVWTANHVMDMPVNAECIANAPDGGFVICGGYGFTETDSQAFLMKTDAGGVLTWRKTYGAEVDRDLACSVIPFGNNGYVLAGDTQPEADHANMTLRKVNETGDEEWVRSYGGTDADHARGVAPSPDGGFVLAGYTESYDDADNDNADMIVLKTGLMGRNTPLEIVKDQAE